ncbi:TIGR00153 family protein [Gallaecimonas mangrovi]|uniref:TIGR00153 family protein n=1 Tax=Gallaecimonas mangrovi TaxID=2291597 RepID=UPI00300FBBB4
MDKVHECCQTLVPYFEAVLADDWSKASELRNDISRLEKEADALKREIRMTLPSGLFMPVERTDLLELVKEQDRIANKAKDIAGRVLGRKLKIPTIFAEEFSAYLSRCLDATALAAKAINELDELLETGFRGREVELVNRMINELDDIEHDTDELQIRLRRQLLAIEKDLSPIDVMFLYSILEWVGDLADRAEGVGSRLELLLARS